MAGEKKNLGEDPVDIIAALKDAEESSIREIEEAKAGKEERIKKAHEKAQFVRERAKKEAETLKVKLLEEAREEIAKEEESVFAQLKKESDAAGKKKPDPKAIDSAVKLVLEELDA